MCHWNAVSFAFYKVHASIQCVVGTFVAGHTFFIAFTHILDECKHCGASVSEVLAHAYVSGDAPSAALLAPSLVSVSLVGGPSRNDSSSGSRTRSLLFQCDLSPTWGYIRQHCSLCRCSLLCESIPKLVALQPPWPREQLLRKLFETLY